MQTGKAESQFFNSLSKGFTPFKIITPILIGLLLFSALIMPSYAALSPARDLTGTWKNAISENYYVMDSFDPTLRMNDVKVTYTMIITQSANSLSIVLNIDELSSTTDPAYLNEYGYSGVPIVGFNQIAFSGTVSGASFTADELGASTGNAEHIAGTFTTDIITATLTGNAETTDTNGIIVLRDGSSATMPPIATVAPTATPTPAPAPPTSTNLASVSQVQGSAILADTHAAVTTQTPIGAGAEVQTGSDGIVGFNYPDNGGAIYLGANSDAGWVYIEPQTDPINGNISYTVVPPLAGSYSFSEGIEPEEFGQAGLSLAAEVGVGLGIMFMTGAPITLGGAVVVEGTLLLGSGIAYIHEQISPQEGTYDVRPIQVPQGLVMGAGTDYVVTVSNGASTIQVINGSAIFVDQYTNSSVTIQANQVLTLPARTNTGFSQEDLNSDVSGFDSSSINQWWTQTAATPTAVPTAITTPTQTTNRSNDSTSFLSSPMFLAAILLVVIIVIAALLAVTRRKKHSKHPSATQPAMNKNPKTATPAAEPTGIFCPNCGNQLLHTQGLCPFCNSDLSQLYPNTKK
jgi:hypothetical protein